MAIEKWVAAASLGLFVMFVAEIITVFNFLSNPTQEIQPGGKILQYISIGVAPAVILAGTSYLLSRRFGSRFIGSMIIAGGAVLLAGMYLANIMVGNIPSQYLVTEVTITPPLFMAVSIPVMIVGALLFRLKPKPKKIYY
ncbi:MAG TPA: hypothetical protein VJZ17_02815 [Nitrosopumilaceae archaeon]|nr:hypothetical protein [Nitrosopumilaceae archaeon]